MLFAVKESERVFLSSSPVFTLFNHFTRCLKCRVRCAVGLLSLSEILTAVPIGGVVFVTGACRRGGLMRIEEDTPLVVYEDPIRSRHGVIKLKLVQRYYAPIFSPYVVPLIKDHFVEWRDTVELLPMRFKFKKTGFKNFNNTPVDLTKWINDYQSSTGLKAVPFNDNPTCSTVAYEYHDYQWVNRKSIKRGNDVYVDLLRKKFAPLFNSANHKSFFSTVVNEKRHRVRRTKMLYITGTCDPCRTGDIGASWIGFGSYWNHFITMVRDAFGKVAYIRTWQSQDNGYPHFHALVYFNDYEFTTVYRRDDKSWRIHNRQLTPDKKRPCIDALVDSWKWGMLDVRCCDDSQRALTDLLKYVIRDLEGGASDLTNAMVWFFNKKSFAVSRSFMGLFGAFDEPSNADLINDDPITQEAIQEKTLVSIDVFPILPRDLMPFYSQLMLDDWDRPPDLSPETVEFLETFADSCVCSKSVPLKSNPEVTVNVFKYREDLL